MNDLVSFLRARLDEDEAAATPGRRALDDLRFDLKRGDEYEQHLSSRIEDGLDSQTVAWDARVLREVEAGRRIVGLHQPEYTEYIDGDGDDRSSVDCSTCDNGGVPDTWPCPTIRAAVAVYSDHPDYRPEWKP